MQLFNPERLQFVLDRRGLTQTALADLLGVSSRQVRNYLSDGQVPDLNILAKALDFPVEFFVGENKLPETEPQAVSFRARSRMSKKLYRQAVSHRVSAILLNDWLEQEFNLKQSDLPDYSDVSPEEAAEAVRLEWGLGYQPIGNLIALLEAKGIRVFSLSMETESIDAFCTWHDSRPFIFLNTLKSAERSRFDAAHELGHLVRDKYSMEHMPNNQKEKELLMSRDIEKEANDFASAFLMPKRAMLPYKNTSMTIDNLIKIKKIFGVSLVALAYRLHKLGIISDWLYIHVLCPQFAKNKYRTKEPEPMDRESSDTLKKILTMLKNEGISIETIASYLHIPAEDIANLTFNLVDKSLTRYRKLRLIK